MGNIGLFDDSKTKKLGVEIRKILKNSCCVLLDELENNPLKVKSEDLKKLVEKYFNVIGFCVSSYDDQKIQDITFNIELLFQYIDSLNLNNSIKYELIDSFFERLGRYPVEESRGLYNLLTSDSIFNNKTIRSFLKYETKKEYNERNILVQFTNNLYKCLSRLSLEEKDKLKYAIDSSFDALNYLIYSYRDLDKILSKSLISNFSKESLSLLFRFEAVYHINFFESDERFLKVISKMDQYVYNLTGNRNDFLDIIIRIFNNCGINTIRCFVDLITSYYDVFYENSIKSNFEGDHIFYELLSYILECSGNVKVSDVCGIELKDFCHLRINKMERKYMAVFGDDGFLKLKIGSFNPDVDFKDIVDKNDLVSLKIAYFYRVYGISYENAKHIFNRYGKFLDVCREDFLSVDSKTLDILEAICNIYALELEDKEKVKFLQLQLYKYIKDNGIFKKNNNLSFLILRGLINRMYMRSFENKLYDESLGKVLYRVDGVDVIDADVNFNMIVNSIHGVGSFFRCKDFSNSRIKYNTSKCSNNQGICASYINNENLGVISLSSPLFGYRDLDINSLGIMGIGDIYSSTGVISLRNGNGDFTEGRFFLTADKFIDYSRFGYNEVVFDRFISDDKNNKLKVQPNYIVVYKIDDNYKNTRMYKNGIKIAKEFGVPVVLIDVKKIKEHEKKVVLNMEKELFSSNKVNKELMKEIITRYMNNYSGAIVISRSGNNRGSRWKYGEDFSVKGLQVLLEKVDKKMESLNETEIREWESSLKECYNLEKEKNRLARQITEYGESLKEDEFLLDDIVDFSFKVNEMVDKNINRYIYSNKLIQKDKKIFVANGKKKPELEMIVSLSNVLFNKSYIEMLEQSGRRFYMTKEADNLSEEEKLACGIIISYLIGNYKDNYFDNLNLYEKDNIYISKTEESIIKNSSYHYTYKDRVYKSPFLMNMVFKIKEMSDEEFELLLRPLVYSQNYNYLDIFNTIMSRKAKIVEEFSILPEKKLKIKKITKTKM